MTVKSLTEKLKLEIIVCGDMSAEVTGGYTGDLLSWVMGRASEGDAWITVMGNVNAVAVAVLADTACIILADSSPLDDEARLKAEQQGVCILRSEKTAFELSSVISGLLS